MQVTKDIQQVIRKRRTLKVMNETPLATKPCDKVFIKTLIESAHYAPYHYPCFSDYQKHLASPLPWRFYVVDSTSCRHLSEFLSQKNLSLGKIIPMLNGADYLIQATWCPQPKKNTEAENLFDGGLISMEHLAASGAAIQNLLLTTTSLGYENYWSSGGPLREIFTYQKIGIPEEEILLGALFIFPSEDSVDENVTFSTSKQRDKRGSVSYSYRFVDFSE